MMTLQAPLLAALAAVGLWSTNAYAAERALEAMSLGWVLLIQYGTAATALLAFDVVRRMHVAAASASSTRPAPQATGSAQPHSMAVLVGVVGLTGTIFMQYVAFALAPIVAANVLTYGWPLLAAGWLAATVRSRQAVRSAALAVIGFGGVALIFTSPTQAGADTATSADATWGYLAALGSAACMTLYTLGAGRITATGTSPLIPATLVGASAAALLVVIGNSSAPPVVDALSAAYIGLGPMAAGYALWTRAMAGGGAERLSPLGYATPLLSTVLLLTTGAPATTRTLLGVALVLACSLGVLAHARPANPQALRCGAPRPIAAKPVPESGPSRTDHARGTRARPLPRRSGSQRQLPGHDRAVSLGIRPAGPSDAHFLTEMLVAAAFWRPDGPAGSIGEVLDQPELAHYVAGWPRPGDLGVIAQDEHPIGAAWLRFYPENDPGYGFVDAVTPELSMGVVRTWRARGVGTLLLDALIVAAREQGLVALSASVDPDNHARRLYDRFGFHQVGTVTGSLTMLLRL